MPQVEKCYKRAEELCLLTGEPLELFTILRGQCVYYRLSRGLCLSVEIGERMVRLASLSTDITMQVDAHANLGCSLMYMGEFNRAYQFLSKGVDMSLHAKERKWLDIWGQDSTVICHAFLAHTLWFLGYPDQSRQMLEKSIRLARELGHKNSESYAFVFAGQIAILQNNVGLAQEVAKNLIKTATEGGNLFWLDWNAIFFGWVEVAIGEIDSGLAKIREYLPEDPRSSGGALLTWVFAVYAESLARNSDYSTGLEGIERVLDYGERCGEYYWEVELYRLRGELLLLQSQLLDLASIQAEQAFEQALTIARKQNAKSWELRAATSLAKLWQQQGRREDAWNLLAPVYQWFTEGFDTYDLVEAKKLLQTVEAGS